MNESFEKRGCEPTRENARNEKNRKSDATYDITRIRMFRPGGILLFSIVVDTKGVVQAHFVQTLDTKMPYYSIPDFRLQNSIKRKVGFLHDIPIKGILPIFKACIVQCIFGENVGPLVPINVGGQLDLANAVPLLQKRWLITTCEEDRIE
jgi:hypothetical protein